MMRLGILLMAGVLEDGIEDHIMKSSRQWIDKNFDGVYLADSLDAERTGNHIHRSGRSILQQVQATTCLSGACVERISIMQTKMR